MPSVSPCPFCGQPTTIPENVDAEAIVRCPICHYEFDLGHALMNAAEAPPEHIAELPPELVPTTPVAVGGAPAQAVEGGPSTETGEPDPSIVPSSPAENGSATAGGAPFAERAAGIGLASKRRSQSPVRNLIGLVASGLLGLAVAYGLLNWIGPRQLRFWNAAKPPAEGANSASDSDAAAATKPPEPGSDDEFPGVDTKRFSEGPENVSPLDPQTPPSDPGYSKVRDFLLYGLSLPERALRSASGIVAGSVRESASLLVPQAFRSSKTYSIMVQQMLDFLAEDVGGVARTAAAGADQTRDFVARKAVGSFMDMASLATLHLSPILLLAVVGDLAYGSRTYLHELAASLKARGVVDQHSTIDNVDDLLAAVAGAAQTTAGTLNAPPISVAGLKHSIDDARAAIAKIDPAKVLPQAELQRLWDDIHHVASQQGLDPLAVSGAMTLYVLHSIGSIGRGALSTVTAAGTLFDRHVLAHYAGAIREIRTKGVYAALRQTSRPYLEAVWSNFSAKRTTLTEDVFSGRLIARCWRAVSRRLGRKEPPPPA